MLVRLQCIARVSSVVAVSLSLVALGGPTATADDAGQMRSKAVYDWHLAPSLAALRAEINARWPARDRSSDGAVGDESHQRSTNSHNPARYPGGPTVGTLGAVHALDITANGVNPQAILNAVIGDPRVWYVIYGGQIWSRTTEWAPRITSGDPHTTHLHINLREDSQVAAVAAETDAGRWLTAHGSGAPRGASAPIGRNLGAPQATGARAQVVALQRALIARGYGIRSGATGHYGHQTTRAVATFQRAQGWSGTAADGVAGPQTLRRLGVSATTVATIASRTPLVSSSVSGDYVPGTASRAVYFLQAALIDRGFDIPAGTTGYFGAKTVQAVKAFQLGQGFSGAQADGVPGARTLKALGLA